MAAVTLLGAATFTTSAGTKTVTATPAVGDLLVLVLAHTGVASLAAPTDNNADGGGTYSLAGTVAVKATSADRLGIYVRDALVGSATSTVFTSTAPGSSGGGLVVLKVTGMLRTGSSAIRQAGRQDNQAAATPAPAFGAVGLTGNACAGAVFNATSPATLTPPASWTERADVGYSTPTTGLEVASRDSGNTASTITWGSASASAFCSAILELDITAPTYTGSGTLSPARASLTGTGTFTAGAATYTGSGTLSPALGALTGAGTRTGAPTSNVVVDSFSDVSGVTLQNHVGETGAVWAKNSSVVFADGYISNANRYRGTDSGNDLYYASGVPASAEYDVEADFVLVGGITTTAGIGGRASTTVDTGLYVYYPAAGSGWILAYNNAGAYTELGTYTQALVEGVPVHVKLQIRDAAKKVFIDGVERISSADNTITQVGRGLIFARSTTNTTGTHIDSYTLAPLAGGVTGSGTLSPARGALTGSGTSTPPTYTGSGSLAPARGTLTGTGTRTTPTWTGSGTLSPARGSLTGAGTFATVTYTATGTVAPARGSLTGTGTRTVPVYTATGTLSPSRGTVSGTGTRTVPTYTGSGALSAARGSLTGSGAFATVMYTGTGSLAPARGGLVGTGAFTAPVYTATGTLSPARGTLTGTGTRTVPTWTGSGTLTPVRATLTGTGAFIPPGGVVGTGTLAPARGALSGTGTHTGPTWTGTGTLGSARGALPGTGAFLAPGAVVGTGVLSPARGTLTGTGAFVGAVVGTPGVVLTTTLAGELALATSIVGAATVTTAAEGGVTVDTSLGV